MKAGFWMLFASVVELAVALQVEEAKFDLLGKDFAVKKDALVRWEKARIKLADLHIRKFSYAWPAVEWRREIVESAFAPLLA